MNYAHPIMFATALAAGSVSACETLLSKDADRLLAPIITHRVAAYAEEFDADGHWKGESPHSLNVEKQLSRLLGSRSKGSNEAVAALSRIYLGEHNGEAVSCSLLRRGKRVTSQLERFSECVPRGQVWRVPESITLVASRAEEELERIRNGERCIKHE